MCQSYPIDGKTTENASARTSLRLSSARCAISDHLVAGVLEGIGVFKVAPAVSMATPGTDLTPL